jgi:hypothetical protein
MKSAIISKAFLIVILCISVYACKTKSNYVAPATTSEGGKGGLATMQVTMEHDKVYVDTGMVYMKYNAVVKPTDNKYDDSAKVVVVKGTPMAIFTELKAGNYFLYGKGWDILRSKTCAGTRPFTIDANGSTGTNQLILLVTAQ